MAKFYGEIGFGVTVEDPPNSSVWVDHITEVSYYGDVVRSNRRLGPGENLSSDISVNNSISIVSDAYANNNIFAMKYIRWMGALWIVSNVDVQSPRLILELGGVYNGPTA